MHKYVCINMGTCEKQLRIGCKLETECEAVERYHCKKDKYNFRLHQWKTTVIFKISSSSQAKQKYYVSSFQGLGNNGQKSMELERQVEQVDFSVLQ